MLPLLLFIIVCISCDRNQKAVDTPQEFKNKAEVSKEFYKTDSLKILNVLNKMVVSHEDFFYSYSSEYVDSTHSKVLIDTILYNEDKNKIFVLVTVEFVAKEFRKEIDGKLKVLNNVKLYDGIGIMIKSKHENFIFKEYFHNIGNYSLLADCKNYLRKLFFKELSTSNETGYNLYNIDDIRMWDEPMWDKF